MKSKRTIGLVIALVLVVGAAVYYFTHEDALFEDGPLAVTLSEPGIFFHNGNAEYEVTPDEQSIYLTAESLPYPGHDTSVSDAPFEDRVQNIPLGTYANSNYSLFIRELVGVTEKSPWVLTDDYVLSEITKESSQFFITNTSVESMNGYQEVVRTFKNVDTGNMYTLPVIRFWFIGDNVTPEQAVRALIQVPDPAIAASGACSVDAFPTYDAGGIEKKTGPFNTSYQIGFDVEKLDVASLQKISNTSLSNICGFYGPRQMQWSGLMAGTFVADNGVLIYIDPEFSLLSQYDLIRVVKTAL